MEKWKQIALGLLVFLLCAGILNACLNYKAPVIYGEITDFTLGEDGQLASFTIRRSDNGNKQNFSLTEESWVYCYLENISGDEFLREPQLNASVTVDLEKGAVRALWVRGLVERNAAVLSDGTPLDIMREVRRYTYRLTDGTELLTVQETARLENSHMFDELNEAAQEKLLAYYEAQGTLYDEEAELERAYAAWKEEGTSYQCRMLEQYTIHLASSSRVMYYMTSVQLPVEGRTYEELHLGAAFDRETGEHIGNLDLFTCPEEEVIGAILDATVIPTQLLYEEMRAAFRPENLIFFSDDLEIMFPQGTLPSEEYAYYLSVDYDGALREVLHDWAVPEKPSVQ